MADKQEGIQYLNAATGFYEAKITARLPFAMVPEEVRAADARIAEITHLVEPREQQARLDAKRHRAAMKPWKKTRSELAREVEDGTRTGAAIKQANDEIAALTHKIEPEEKKAREDAAGHREFLRPLKAERTELDEQVRTMVRFRPTPAVQVFETNEVVFYRLDTLTREEIVGISEYARRPRTAEEREPLFERTTERAAATAEKSKGKPAKEALSKDPPGTKRVKRPNLSVVQ